MGQENNKYNVNRIRRLQKQNPLKNKFYYVYFNTLLYAIHFILVECLKLIEFQNLD